MRTSVPLCMPSLGKLYLITVFRFHFSLTFPGDVSISVPSPTTLSPLSKKVGLAQTESMQKINEPRFLEGGMIFQTGALLIDDKCLEKALINAARFDLFGRQAACLHYCSIQLSDAMLPYKAVSGG